MKYEKGLMFLLVMLLAVGMLVIGCKSVVDEPLDENGKDDTPATFLDTIMDRGILVVGTSADYPPFESIDEDGEFVGYDMDLIREVGKRLGVEVDIQDLGFDALITSVQNYKVDVAIASMAASEERRKSVDFTLEYHHGKQSFLTKSDAGISFADQFDVVDYTVGVQAGSTLDTWLTEEMIGKGLMEEAQVTRYERAEQIALDIRAGRIQVGFIDAPVAKDLVDSMDNLTIIFTDLVADYGGGAIALPKGEVQLKEALDQIIQELLDEGFIDELYNKWFLEGHS